MPWFKPFYEHQRGAYFVTSKIAN